jgi:xanthine/CO dehydrogenase XdhC/CoxF family maturation factor
MSELRALLAAVRALRETRQPFVSATVWAVYGSGYRKPGARMVATQDQWRAGSISGGCLERDITNKGMWYTRNQRAWAATYDQSADEHEEGTGTGCQGVVEVLIERHTPEHVEPGDVFAAAERCIRDENSAAVLTVVGSTRSNVALGARLVLQADEWYGAAEHADLHDLFAHGATEALAGLPLPYLARHQDSAGEVVVFVECLRPPVHLFVFGTGHDAVPLVAQAKQLGWSVSVWDASPRSSARERFQLADHYLTGSVEEAVARAARSVRGAAVVMGHHFAHDRAAIAALLASGTRYVGVLGSRPRTQQLLEACRTAGVLLDDSALARLHAPVGLPLGAETPAEIALAIVAEIQRTFARASGPKHRG